MDFGGSSVVVVAVGVAMVGEGVRLERNSFAGGGDDLLDFGFWLILDEVVVVVVVVVVF